MSQLLNSDRRGQASSTLRNVKERHEAIQNIEQQMIELAQLFQDLDTMVVQQEEAVVQIEQKGEQINDNLDKANEEIATAVNTSRKTRKKKWICLGICREFFVVSFCACLSFSLPVLLTFSPSLVAIIAIIIIIVLIWYFVIRTPSK